MKPIIENAPGLTWRAKKTGWEARWLARTDIGKRGYYPKAVRLWSGTDPTDADKSEISRKCRELQSAMLDWSNQKPIGLDRAYADKGQIYFLFDGIGIKVGFSTHFQKRLPTIQSSNRARLKVLAVVPGTQVEERRIHSLFNDIKIRGEWFANTRALRQYIKDMSENIPQPAYVEAAE